MPTASTLPPVARVPAMRTDQASQVRRPRRSRRSRYDRAGTHRPDTPRRHAPKRRTPSPLVRRKDKATRCSLVNRVRTARDGLPLKYHRRAHRRHRTTRCTRAISADPHHNQSNSRVHHQAQPVAARHGRAQTLDRVLRKPDRNLARQPRRWRSRQRCRVAAARDRSPTTRTRQAKRHKRRTHRTPLAQPAPLKRTIKRRSQTSFKGYNKSASNCGK